MTNSVEPLIQYFLEIDVLKQVQRRSYIHGGTRLENSAEHSWHLAMACWAVARWFELPLSHEKLLKLALVHDLGEIDAGDTFLYSAQRSDAHNEERACIRRLAALPGNPLDDLQSLWEDQEQGLSPEAQLLKAVDRLLPFMLNIASEGRTWRELGVRASQVREAHAFIASDFPQIHRWIKTQLDRAVEQQWIQP